MSEKLVHYLQLISKLSDILMYINTNFDLSSDVNDLSSYIKECKSICINKVKEESLMTIFLRELYNENQVETQEIEIQEIETQDVELKGKIDILTNMLTGSIQVPQEEQMSPESFETLGSGLAKLFKMNVDEETSKPQKIKNKINEINLTNSNINFEIKRK